MINHNRRLLFVVNTAAFFASHRLQLAKDAIKGGWTVGLAVGRPASEVMSVDVEKEITDHGISFFQCDFKSASTNPLTEFKGLCQLVSVIARFKPQVIHTASPKGGLMGGIAARVLRVPRLIIAVSGMGYLFSSELSIMGHLIQKLYLLIVRWIYKHPNIKVIVQNEDDFRMIVDGSLIGAGEVDLIPGSGVELQLYDNIPPPKPGGAIILPARMVKDKGIYEFVDAARILRRKGYEWQFWLVGAADYKNPGRVEGEELLRWQNEGLVTYLGYQKSMAEVFGGSALVCLPSYREGLPKCLLEAAAAKRAIVTTDVVGCREAICPEWSGLLVEPRNSKHLASAIEALMTDFELLKSFGERGRKIVEKKHDVKIINKRILELYEDAKSG